jgi:hypothetical protein
VVRSFGHTHLLVGEFDAAFGWFDRAERDQLMMRKSSESTASGTTPSADGSISREFGKSVDWLLTREEKK